MTMTVTSIYMKEKRCQMEAAYNMVFGETKMNQFRYNLCMARQDNHVSEKEKTSKIPYNRPKYTITPAD